MSTKYGVRHAPWFALLISSFLLGLSLSPAKAETIRAENGIVIPISLPPAQYASLPSNDRSDPSSTGSLPSTSIFRDKNVTGFRSLVERGTIALRDSTPTNCLPGDLRQVIADVAARFGTVSIQSTHRTQSRNRQAGGARHSLHLACRAIDFRVHARSSGLMAYLRTRAEVGGLKIYRNGVIHIDNGSRRSW